MGDKLVNLKSCQELYRNIADIYEADKSRKALFEIEERHLLHILPSLKNKKVLDVGCGTGRWTRKFLRKGAKTIGIDNSKEMIEIAREKTRNSDFRVMDARNLDFPANYFDFVFSSLMLSHLKNWDKSLKEMIRVARAGGCIIISDIHGAIGGGKARDMKFFAKGKTFAAKCYPIFPSDVMAAAGGMLQIAEIIEVKSSEFQDKMKHFNKEIYYQPTLLIMKLTKR